MMQAIKLFVKSEKQYNRTRESLDALGLRSFLLGGYQNTVDYGITVFLERDTVLRYTDGHGTAATYQPEYVHIKRKEFIEVVKRVLGDAK
jgi:hypothetical protein